MKTSIVTAITDKLIPINELRKRFGEIEKKLPTTDFFILTKKGKPFAILSAHQDVKRELMQRSFGGLKGTDLDNDEIWKEILKKKSRKSRITL